MSTSSKEARRQRGEIACAECRRLKVRCSKTIPCETCVKRGTAALCPNGTIPPGDGSRFVLAAEDHLRRKMSKLEERMHALEDALAIVQTNESKHPHPLLAQSFLLDDDDDLLEEEDTKNFFTTSGLTDAFGALHVENTSQRFFGPSGGSESLLLKAKDLDPLTSQPTNTTPEDIDTSYFPREITLLYESFPFTPSGLELQSAQSAIESFLPSISRATTLCETLLGNMTWMFSIVSRQHIIGELIPEVYNHLRVPSIPRSYGPHDLALLLVTIGIGALVDLTLDPYHPEAQHYYRLARAALGLQSVVTYPSVVTVKCLHLMSIYNGMSGKESNLENSYLLLDFAGQVALAIGFHMDPSYFGFEPREAYRRRAYFWHLIQAILWQSLVTGRPPITSGKFIDCHIPTAEEEYIFEQGEVPLGFGIWSNKFSIECLMPVAEVTLAVNPPTYRSILELDERIRKFDVPVPPSPPGATQQPASTMQRFVREHYRELTLLFLHRGFFAQALTDNPTNPQLSTHGQSFITAFKCACAVLDSTIDQFNQQPDLTPRVWRIWSNAFSAAVIIGTVAIHNPDSRLDPPPFEKFDQACILFRKAAQTSSRAQRALPILVRMRQKARQSRYIVPSQGNIKPGQPHNEPYDELAIFGGRAGLVMPKHSSQSSSTKGTTEPIRIPTIPNLNQPPQSDSGSGGVYPPDDQILQDLLKEQPLSASDSLPSNWENLYREVSEPTFSHGLGNAFMNTGAAPRSSHGEFVMLEDRWSSFMHQYGMLGQVQLP